MLAVVDSRAVNLMRSSVDGKREYKNQKFISLLMWTNEKAQIFTGGGNIVVDEIYGDIPDCATGFPLNDDIPLNVHPIGVDDSLRF